jgi:hypothetical protein
VPYRLATAVAAAAALTFSGAAAASAAAPTAITSCGTTLTGAGYLPRDLTCTGGVGVFLAGDAELDLGGHRLIGPGNGTGGGVRLSTTGTSKVVNGTIRGWASAVISDDDLLTPLDATLAKLRLAGNRTALAVWGGTMRATRLTILDNTSIGLGAFYGADVTVSDSVLRNNSEFGINADEARVHLTRSAIVGSQYAFLCFSSVCDVSRSVVADNDIGFWSQASLGTHARNTYARNRIAFQGGLANSPDAVYDEEVQDNRFVGNDVAVNISGIASTAYRRNTFTRNGVGVRLANEDSDSYDVLLEANTFNRNGDGINLAPLFGQAKLIGNRAVKNTGWGIYAPNAIDLGGNTASGNGNEPQCVGVVC